MKSSLCVLGFFVVPSLALAQTSGVRHGEAYVIAAPFAHPSWGGRATYVAGGGELFVYKGASVGAEVGPIFSGSYVFGLGSATLGYRFSRSDTSTIKPFLTAGYATTFRAGIQNGATAGGGINVRLRENVALRIEFRAYMGRLRIKDIGPRFGITFR